MSERFIGDSIVPVRELRPTEDLSLLQTYELRRVFDSATVSSLGLIETSDLRDPDSFRPISAPLVGGAAAPVQGAADTADPDPIPPVRQPESERLPETTAASGAEVPRRDWLLDPEPIATPAEAQPYGDDPSRVRQLVQWFVDGRGYLDPRAASAAVVAQRPAGDLIEGAPSAKSDPPYRLRAIGPGGRAG